jgi:hypothetical protein
MNQGRFQRPLQHRDSPERNRSNAYVTIVPNTVASTNFIGLGGMNPCIASVITTKTQRGNIDPTWEPLTPSPAFPPSGCENQWIETYP